MRKVGKKPFGGIIFSLSLSLKLFPQVTVPLEKSRGLLPPGSFISFHNDALENNHNDKHVQEPVIAEREEKKSRDNEAVGDVCMGEGVAEEIIEHDQFNGVNKKAEINSDHNGVMSVEVRVERGKQIAAIE